MAARIASRLGMSDESEPMSNHLHPRASRLPLVAVVLSSLALVGVLVLAVIGSKSPATADGAQDEALINASLSQFCQNEARWQLSVPSSGKFDQVTVERRSGSVAFVVSGMVSSTNTTGDKNKSRFRCDVTPVPGGSGYQTQLVQFSRTT